MTGKIIERRYDRIGEIRLMASADGYVMCRRPDCIPFIMTEKAWQALMPTRDSLEGENGEPR